MTTKDYIIRDGKKFWKVDNNYISEEVISEECMGKVFHAECQKPPMKMYPDKPLVENFEIKVGTHLKCTFSNDTAYWHVGKHSMVQNFSENVGGLD